MRPGAATAVVEGRVRVTDRPGVVRRVDDAGGEVDDDGTVVGTGRLLLDGPGHVHLGRLAVLAEHRGRRVGALLVRAIEALALERHAAGEPPAVEVVLSAQESAMGFYAALGYAAVSGERYLDAGIWHQDMARTLTRG